MYFNYSVTFITLLLYFPCSMSSIKGLYSLLILLIGAVSLSRSCVLNSLCVSELYASFAQLLVADLPTQQWPFSRISSIASKVNTRTR